MFCFVAIESMGIVLRVQVLGNTSLASNVVISVCSIQPGTCDVDGPRLRTIISTDGTEM